MKIYHHNDSDGRCGAAIALRAAIKTDHPGPGDIQLIEVDYKDPIDVDAILPDEEIYIVDFSFKPKVMARVCGKTKNIIWIDHHKTAFPYTNQYPCQIRGLRTEDFSGCELAWQWFYPDEPMPRAVVLIGDYDKWALRQPRCFEFYEGLKMEDTKPKSELWDVLLCSDANPLTYNMRLEIVKNGKAAIKYRDSYCSKVCHDFGYEVEFEGHKAFACNIYQFGSKGFGDRMEQYDFCIAYIHDGHRFTVSLYSVKGVDVGEICKKYGGGGHGGAAGFVVESLPFKREKKGE